MAERNDPVRIDRRIEFRIGINLGDIINDRDDIFAQELVDRTAVVLADRN
jgi:hypothetical protein